MMHRTTIMLPEHVHQQAKVVAAVQGISLGELIRQALLAMLQAHSKAQSAPDAVALPARVDSNAWAAEVRRAMDAELGR